MLTLVEKIKMQIEDERLGFDGARYGIWPASIRREYLRMRVEREMRINKALRGDNS